MDSLIQGIWIINTKQQETGSVSLEDHVITFILTLMIITFLVLILEFIILSILEDTSIASTINIVGVFVSIMLSVIIAPTYFDKLNNEK